MQEIRKIVAILAVATALATGAQAQVISNWTFENVAVGTGSGTDFSYGGADSGALVAGSAASGHHASASTAWTFPQGTGGAGRALSANNWAAGDYFQFSLSTVGFQNINVSFSQLGSSTGPANYQFSYSTDGTNFTNFGSQITLTSMSAFQTNSFNLSIVTGLNNAATIYFRIVDVSTVAIGGGTVGTTGTGRIDDFTVTATPIPEPATYMLFGMGLLVCAQQFRRRRAASNNK